MSIESSGVDQPEIEDHFPARLPRFARRGIRTWVQLDGVGVIEVHQDPEQILNAMHQTAEMNADPSFRPIDLRTTG